MTRSDRAVLNGVLTIIRKMSLSEEEKTSMRGFVHDMLLKERKARRAAETERENLGYVVLNRGMNDDGDAWEKRLYPGEVWSEEDISDYIASERMHSYFFGDCTGERFTYSIRIFNTPAGVLMYKFSAIDC